MRDNHKGMPEIVDTFVDADGIHNGIVAIEIDSEIKKFRFGVSLASYHALKRILQLRPFDTMPGLKHRYFYAGSCRKLESANYEVAIRVEQGSNGIGASTINSFPFLPCSTLIATS